MKYSKLLAQTRRRCFTGCGTWYIRKDSKEWSRDCRCKLTWSNVRLMVDGKLEAMKRNYKLAPVNSPDPLPRQHFLLVNAPAKTPDQNPRFQ